MLQFPAVLIVGNESCGFVLLRIGLFAPLEGLHIQVNEISETSTREEVVFDIVDQSLTFALCLGSARLAEAGRKTQLRHEAFIAWVEQYFLASLFVKDTFHHVGENRGKQASEIHEGMDHADEQLLLSAHAEELNIPLPTRSADDHQAGHFPHPPGGLVIIMGISPVHLRLLTILGFKTHGPFGSRYRLHSRAKLAYILPQDGDAATIPSFLNPIVQRFTVEIPAFELFVQIFFVRVELAWSLPSFRFVLLDPFIEILAHRVPTKTRLSAKQADIIVIPAFFL